jgi:chemotaxis response regulator CheB
VIAPSGLSLSLLPRQPSHTVCPAGDPLLMSAARSFGRRALGVVLTGIGSDCVVGASHVFAASGAVLVQDPRSALAGSMPENVREANPDAIVLSPSSLPEAIKAHLDVLAEL